MLEKSWESDIVEWLVPLYWLGIGYMILVVIVNKSNEPIKRTRNEILKTSIEEHKNQIEKYIDINGKFKDTYKIDNSEFLAYHLVEYFNDERELKFLESRGWFSKSKIYVKRSDHDRRMRLIAKVIKEKGLIGFVFWEGLYKGQAYEIYHGIRECDMPGCYNQVSEKWHQLCQKCFYENKQEKYFRTK